MDNRNVTWTNDGALVVCLFIKAVVVSLLLYTVMQYSFTSPSEDALEANRTSEVALANKTRLVARKVVVLQPSCPLSYVREVLRDLLTDLHFRKLGCRAEDVDNAEKHEIPRPPVRPPTRAANPRGTIVVYFAVGLLLTSLGAACLEVFRAKGQGGCKARAPLTRKCSLADLTVLRHSRKELVRRESVVLEGVVEHHGSLRTLGRKVSRPPLRALE